ncbi:hypothetical protein [Mycobacterium sp.]|uniref:hypothetical protein n=1 Tax=Mycobacterium sp. TaxID=1785 RepID=UPI003F974DBE
MPADRGGQVDAGGYQLPPGSYAKLLRKQCESRAELEHIVHNPRCDVLVDDWRPALVELEKARKLAAAAAAEMFEQLLAAGEPIVVPGFGVAAPGAPDWLRLSSWSGGASSIRVYPDDVCEPAAFRGERNGVGFEQVPVAPRHQHHAC